MSHLLLFYTIAPAVTWFTVSIREGAMTQRTIRKNQFYLLICSIFLSASIFAQDDFDKVQVTSTKVAGKIWMLQGQGGNIAVSIGDDGTLMVDDEFAPLADKIRAAIASLGGSEPKFLLNTHWHGDHTGGNELFADKAIIIAQTNVRERLADPANKRDPKALPIITFDDHISIFFNGEEIKLMYLPAGHTDGDAAIWFTGSNVLHMGDQFFAVRFPFVDTSSGGTVRGVLANTQKMLAMLPDDIKIIPGHGGLSTKADFARYIAGLRETTDMIWAAKASGMSLKDVVAKGLGAKYKDWGAGFISEEAWITTVYNSPSR